MDVDARAESLADELGVDAEEIRRSLQNLVEYDVPIDEAVQSVRRNYGGSGGGTSSGPSDADVGEITTDTGSVSVTARVLTVGKRPIQYQGEEQVILEGELADGTGTISYTAWEPFEFEAGDTVRIGNAGVREWEGRPELNLGERTTVEILEETLDVDASVGGAADLIDLEPGDRGRTITVRVVETERRTIDGRDGETEINSGVLADETARLPFTDWGARAEFEEGASLTLGNVYVREFRGVPSVNCSRFTTIRAAEEPVEPGGPTELPIRTAVDRGGVYDAALTGTIIQVRENSGLIQRCPECNRLAQNGQCRTHGDVEPVDDLRVKAILDDGTGTVTVVLDAEQTERIYGGGVEAAREEAREAMDQSAVADTIAGTLVGRQYRVRGHLSIDEYGATLEVTEFDEVSSDPAAAAASFLDAVEAAAAGEPDEAAEQATDGGTSRGDRR